MPRDHGRVLCKIWRDKDFRALPRTAQTTYVQLLSQDSVNNAGVLPLQVSKWVKGCDELTESDIWRDLKVLSERGYIVVDVDSFEVLIRSFIRNDGGMAHKYIFKNALSCAEAVESEQIRKALALELYRLRRADATRVADILSPPDDLDPIPSEPDSNAEVNPSESHSNPIETASESGMAFEPDSNHCGVGEGEGVGETPVAGYVGGSRASAHASADACKAEPPPTESPSRHCPRHPDGTADPCRACQAARQTHDIWTAQQRRAAEAARADAARAAAEDRHRAIADCALCDDTGYRGTAVCDHDPDTVDRAQRGMAAVKAALAQRRPTESLSDV